MSKVEREMLKRLDVQERHDKAAAENVMQRGEIHALREQLAAKEKELEAAKTVSSPPLSEEEKADVKVREEYERLRGIVQSKGGRVAPAADKNNLRMFSLRNARSLARTAG